MSAWHRLQSAWRGRCAAPALLALLAGCGGGGSTPADANDPGAGSGGGVVGPCVHQFLEPVLQFDSAVRRDTRAAVPLVTLSGVTLNGAAVATEWLMSGARNLIPGASAGTLVCTLPCGLGTLEGRYAMDLTATGLMPQHVSVDARYTRFSGGCPSSSSGGTHMALEWVPQS